MNNNLRLKPGQRIIVSTPLKSLVPSPKVIPAKKHSGVFVFWMVFSTVIATVLCVVALTKIILRLQ